MGKRLATENSEQQQQLIPKFLCLNDYISMNIHREYILLQPKNSQDRNELFR